MNDRYKFRVWDKVGERMIVDVQDFIPLKITNKGILRLNPLHEENLYTLIEFGDPFIPMQCIGLKDKNGALIFEGDIIKFRAHDYSVGDTGYIIYDNEKACFSIKWNDGLIHECPTYYNRIDKTFEIIGNIYNNPELVQENWKDSNE